MKIFATFANRTYDHEAVELLHAWDEFSFDENPTGYEDTKREAVASLGGDLFRWVTVEIDVEAAEIYEALAPTAQARGEVTSMGEPHERQEPA